MPMGCGCAMAGVGRRAEKENGTIKVVVGFDEDRARVAECTAENGAAVRPTELTKACIFFLKKY